MWNFQTDAQFEHRLAWARTFVRDEVRPLETFGDLDHRTMRRLVAPLQHQVKDRGLFAAHLPPELGGSELGQVELALLNEIVGTCEPYGPIVFGNQPPDAGNAELIALAGNEEQKRRWLQGILEGRIYSCFAMTELGRGSDPTTLETKAERTTKGWVLNGMKWFSSNAPIAELFIVMARTNHGSSRRDRFSMLLVPADTPGISVREIQSMQHPYERPPTYASEGEVTFTNVHLDESAILGREGAGFRLAQRRLGPGRIQHCMRWVGQCRRALDMLCERAISASTAGSLLAEKQTVQNWVADSYAEISALRLMTLQTAWVIDNNGVDAARTDISAIKFFGAKVLHDVIDRALQVHGSLGYSCDMPLERMYRLARAARIYDGPDEVHRVAVAKGVLRNYEPSEIPREHLPTRRARALMMYGADLEV